jgi:hypothetical protein
MAKKFSEAIAEIMPLVEDGDSSTPFVISRDRVYGDWLVHCPYPAENAAGFLKSRREHDPYAVMYKGSDFSDAGFASVYDKVLCARLRAEYDAVPFGTLHGGEFWALINAVEDNIGRFSGKTVDRLLEYDNPLRALYDLNPIPLFNRNNPDGEPYDGDKVDEFIEAVEYLIEDIVNRPKDTRHEIETVPGADEIPGEPKRVIDGHYTEVWRARLAGREVFLAADEKEDAPYLVCTARWDNPFGVTEYLGGAVSADYVEAMREFVNRVDILLSTLEKERAAFPEIQPTLTAADCVPGGLDGNLTDKAVVIKPDVLSPEYRTANHQLKIVRGGFGARPNARGNAVICKDLYSGKVTQFERRDIAGVIDPARLPEWAKEKLAHQEAQKEPPAKTRETPKQPPQSKKTPSLLGEVREAVATVEQRKAERGNRPADSKRAER